MTDSRLALRGSTKVVCDYFVFAINNILFQRGIYPPDDFQTVKKYDLPLLLTIDDDIKQYINQFLSQIKKWVYGTLLKKLILVIIDKDTGEGVERWEFDIVLIESDDTTTEKPDHLIKKEIQSIIRQITSSNTYLPLLDGDFTFNILVHTEQDINQIPTEWCDVQDNTLKGDVESVDFSTFKTKLHSIGTKVSYRVE